MRCPRCGHRIRGASWYCPNCGAGTDNLEADVVQDQHRRRRTAAAAASVALCAGLVAWVASRPEPPQRAAAPTATRPLTALITPTLTPRREPARPEAAPSPTQPAEQAATAAARPTARVREGSPVWSASRLNVPPVLDGWLDDWPTTPQSLAAIVGGQAAWSGAADLSARALVGWDDDALYVGVRVFDEAFSAPPAGVGMDGGDHVAVQLDADLYGDWDRRTYDIDDWHIGLSPGDLAGRAPEGWAWRPRVDAAGRIQVAARRLDDGYIVESAIPWALIGYGPPRTTTSAGAVAMGFALSVIDVDGGEGGAPASRTVLTTSPERTLDDPRTLGALVFE